MFTELRRVGKTLAMLLCAIPAHLSAEASPTIAIPALSVEDLMPASTMETPDEAEHRLDQIPGGTTLVDEARIRDGRTANLADALDLAPGVYARSRFGQVEVRLSIRGSGISRTFNNRGIRLLRDGLPVTEADGNTRTQLIDPLTAQYMEIYRGANAMGFGAATLGGAVNLVSPTGYTSPRIRLRGDTGGFGYRRLQATGAWLGAENLDGVATIAGSTQHGFRDHSAQRTARFYGNIGFQHGDHQQTRIHLEAQDSRLQLPGSLTPKEYRQNPRLAAPGHEDVDASRNITLARLSAQHAIRLRGDDQLQFGGFVQDLQMDHPLPFAQIDGDQQDAGLSLRHRINTRLLGRANHLTWGMLGIAGREENVQTLRSNGTVIRRDYQAATLELFADNTLDLTERTRFIAGVQMAWATRRIEVPSSNALEARQTYRSISPRAGITHQLSPTIQLFGNLSRSVEPPINGELITFGGQIVDEQRADTLELGIRARYSRLQWEAVAYQARVRDEILIFQDPGNPQQTASDNADRTTHQGLEVGMTIALPLDNLTIRGDSLEVSAVLNYNRFRFDGDPRWGNNSIPGIPDYAGRIEMRYRQARGFYAGPTVEMASSYPVDFANTLEVDDYTIWGARVGFKSQRGWRAFLEGRNLGNRRYVSNTAVVADAGVNVFGSPNNRVINPGATRSIHGGVEWEW
ncbi:MAG: TonB-dependent receptor [Aquisalimonadaceae bacterium]